MNCLRIAGGVRLEGIVAVSGSKNAALPIMAASILADGPIALARVPRLADVDTLSLLLGTLGVEVKRNAASILEIQSVDPRPIRADYELVRRMRASFCVLGPLVARRGRAVVSLPGGCNIGTRPVDLHLRALSALGADIRIEHGYVFAEARRLKGADIDLGGPFGPTVTGTANAMSAATLARGRTTLINAAQEPEIVDLGNFLIATGARIEGLGTDTIEITGVERLAGARYEIIPDRIEAGTLLIAAAATAGAITVAGANPCHLTSVLLALAEIGADVRVESQGVSVSCERRPRPTTIAAGPYPGIPSDLQAQFMALLAVASGESRISDRVFPDRFMHVAELNRLGARIERHLSTATVHGVARLTGAAVMASDLRASAALVVAGLSAERETKVARVYHLDRGYERLEAKLSGLGARIWREADRERPWPTSSAIAGAPDANSCRDKVFERARSSST
jgi:UDP-N-acetylglucosamine 1-carboxyvinyltransferase